MALVQENNRNQQDRQLLQFISTTKTTCLTRLQNSLSKFQFEICGILNFFLLKKQKDPSKLCTLMLGTESL